MQAAESAAQKNDLMNSTRSLRDNLSANTRQSIVPLSKFEDNYSDVSVPEPLPTFAPNMQPVATHQNLLYKTDAEDEDLVAESLPQMHRYVTMLGDDVMTAPDATQQHQANQKPTPSLGDILNGSGRANGGGEQAYLSAIQQIGLQELSSSFRKKETDVPRALQTRRQAKLDVKEQLQLNMHAKHREPVPLFNGSTGREASDLKDEK